MHEIQSISALPSPSEEIQWQGKDIGTVFSGAQCSPIEVFFIGPELLVQNEWV
jgi:hypothetical protein